MTAGKHAVPPERYRGFFKKTIDKNHFRARTGIRFQVNSKLLTEQQQLQTAVADYLHLQYPQVFFTHIINERDTGIQSNARCKQMGVRKGMPDILIFEPISEKDRFGEIIRIKKCGLALEFKISQDKFIHEEKQPSLQLTGQGWITAICHTFEQAKHAIDIYFSENKNIQN